MMMRVSASIASVCVLAIPTPGNAQIMDPQCANITSTAITRRGVDLWGTGAYGEARVVLQRAWACFHEPQTLARLGLLSELTGDWEAAEDQLTHALTFRDDPVIAQRREGLEASLRNVRTHLGRLTVRCNVPNAILRVNGSVTYDLPRREPLRIVLPLAGTVSVEIYHEGYRTFSDAVSFGSDPSRLREISVTLQPLFTPTPPPPASPTGPWLLVGVGAASLITGVLLAGPVAGSEKGRFDQVCPARVCPPDRLAEAMDYEDSADRARAAGWAVMGTGIGLIVGGVIWRIATRTPSGAGASRLSFGLGLSGDVRVGGSF